MNNDLHSELKNRIDRIEDSIFSDLASPLNRIVTAITAIVPLDN